MSLTPLILLGDRIEDLFKKLVNRCTVIKFLRSSIVNGLYLVLLSECNKDHVERMLRDLGGDPNVSYMDEFCGD